MKKTRVFIVLLAIFFHIELMAEETLYSYERIKSALSIINSQSTFPAIKGSPTNNTITEEKIPDWILESSNELQNAYFGKQVLSIVSTTDCEICTDSNRKKIFLNLRFVEWILSQNLLADKQLTFKFILAHEVGHYAYEYFVNKFKISPNGFPSLQPEEIPQFGRNSEQPSALGVKGHIEVDLFALLIFKKLNYPYPKDFLRLLISMENKPYSYETSLRILTLENAIDIF